MLGDTFGEVKDNADQEWHLVYAQIIMSIESEIPQKNLQEVDYWANVGGKRYLQVQEVNKEYFGKVVESEEHSLSDILKDMDLDKDGKISLDELKMGERKLKEQGITISVKEGATEHDYVAPIDHNLGPSMGTLEGRLDPKMFTP